MNLERLLSTPKLTEQTPPANLIRDRANVVAPNPIKVFYGETYDEKGNPIDSMKYYFFVSYLAEALRKEGFTVDSSILIADTAAARNAGKGQEKYYMALGEERRNFVKRVNDTYGTKLHLTKMSDFIHTPKFVSERTQLIEACEANPELMKAIAQTVPESKVEVERKKGFLYSFDEVTAIIDLDVKVGPPREDLYDKVARVIAQSRNQSGLMSLFLTPTFPVGMDWAYFFINQGIEDHGITAYKAGSKRLHRNRIIVGHSQPDTVRTLLQDSFISTNPNLPNPVLDVGIICEMARKRLEMDDSPITLADEFYEGTISPDDLKVKVGHDIEKYILSKF